MKQKKTLKDLTLLDRFLFAEAMEDPENMRTVLEIILGKEVVLKYLPQAEKEMCIRDRFGYMSVAENLFLPYEKSGFKGFVNQKMLEEKAVPLLERFRIPVRPDDLVKDISVSSQQMCIRDRLYVFQCKDEDYESITQELKVLSERNKADSHYDSFIKSVSYTHLDVYKRQTLQLRGR